MERQRTRPVVLLVDDSPTQAQRATCTLEQAGYRVQLATNGRTALEQARRWRPDVIVSDVVMPVLDGFGFCREVRRDADLAAVPVVLHTMTFIDPRDEEFARALGATRYVLKPADPRELVEQVREVLAIRHTGGTPFLAADTEAFLVNYG